MGLKWGKGWNVREIAVNSVETVLVLIHDNAFR